MWKLQCRYPFGRLLRLAIVAVFYVAASEAVANGTIEEAQRIQSEAYRNLLDMRFANINAMADRFMASKARLPDGRWKLPFVISGLTEKLPSSDAKAWESRLRLVDKWIAQTPNNATPYLAKAELLIAYAWDARGSGYANTVKDADWPIFQQRIDQARAILEKSAAVSKQSPLWYEKMQSIATAQSWSEEEFLRLFSEGVSKEPTDYFLYFNAANYLLPRWHGSAARLAEFVDTAVKATEQQEGQTLYARIYWSLLLALQGNTFSPGYAEWPRMRQGFEDIVRVYPDNWNLNAFAYYACMAGDKETAKVIGSKLSSPELELWKDRQTFDNCTYHASKGRRKS